jgi:hypothetical protein
MSDARFYRERAHLTLQLARQISDGKAAAELRQMAAHYEARAIELEVDNQPERRDSSETS